MKFKNLERYRKGGTRSRMELEIPAPRTPDGRVYQHSPNEHAHPRHFVIGDVVEGFEIDVEKRKRMKLEPNSGQTVCPYSGTIGSNEEFVHPDDRKAAIETVKHAAAEDASEALHGMLDDMKRRQGPKSALQIETSPRRRQMKPHFRRRDLLRELICDHCGRDYGVYAIALFCPDCGAPNVRLHFAREKEIVLRQVDLAESQGDDEELAYRLLGNAHEDVLTAFEATLKTVYMYRVSRLPADAETPKRVRNDFQNIEKAQVRFQNFEFNPFAGLAADKLETLGLNIQKRHLIGHNLGVIDEKFIEHAGDAKLGETVELVGADIREFAALCQQVVDRLDAWLIGDEERESVHTKVDTEMKKAASVKTESECTYGELSKLATDLARWLGKSSEDGMCWPVRDEFLLEAFADVPVQDLEEAIAELDADGFVTTSRARKGSLPRFRPTPDLFIVFDPMVLKSDPMADACELIQLVLDGEESVSVSRLHEKTGWELRRFNPALSLVLEEVDDRRVSKSGDEHYPTSFFALMAEDRVALKRLGAKLRGQVSRM